MAFSPFWASFRVAIRFLFFFFFRGKSVPFCWFQGSNSVPFFFFFSAFKFRAMSWWPSLGEKEAKRVLVGSWRMESLLSRAGARLRPDGKAAAACRLGCLACCHASHAAYLTVTADTWTVFGVGRNHTSSKQIFLASCISNNIISYLQTTTYWHRKFK